MARIRGVAQPGRVLGLGPRCRRFEPSHPDQKIQIGLVPILILCLWVQTKIFLIVFWNQIPESRHPRLDPGSTAPQAE